MNKFAKFLALSTLALSLAGCIAPYTESMQIGHRCAGSGMANGNTSMSCTPVYGEMAYYSDAGINGPFTARTTTQHPDRSKTYLGAAFESGKTALMLAPSPNAVVGGGQGNFFFGGGPIEPTGYYNNRGEWVPNFKAYGRDQGYFNPGFGWQGNGFFNR